MFSKACEYGIKASIYVSQQSQQGIRVSLKSISQGIDSPLAFTAKVLQTLANNNIIESTKGPTGGYEIPEKRRTEITLLQIVEAIDGNKIYNGCGLGFKQCNELKPCSIHFQFKAIRDELKNMLQNTSIEELGNGMHNGLAFLKR